MPIASRQPPGLPVGGERLREEMWFQRGDTGVNRNSECPSSEKDRGEPGGGQNHA